MQRIGEQTVKIRIIHLPNHHTIISGMPDANKFALPEGDIAYDVEIPEGAVYNFIDLVSGGYKSVETEMPVEDGASGHPGNFYQTFTNRLDTALKGGDDLAKALVRAEEAASQESL